MEAKTLVRVGVGSRDHALTNKGSFNFPVTRSEREFLMRLSKATQAHSRMQDNAGHMTPVLVIQDIDEVAGK